MPNYDLNALGAQEFERLTQSLLKVVIAAGTITFGAGPDDGREATFSGSAPYPSADAAWAGSWIFQAKFHDVQLLGTDKARKSVVADLESELSGLAKRSTSYDNFIMITNVPLSSVAETGTHDQLAQVAIDHSGTAKNVHVWGYDDLCRYLEVHGAVRQAYLQFLTTGDVIARLLGRDPLVTLDETVRLALVTDFQDEGYAQLDQAGDVGDDSLPLASIFIDLEVILASSQKGALPKEASLSPDLREALNDRDVGASAVPLILGEVAPRVVFIGGPGQGKSTLGQFIAQVHRGALLGKLSDVIGADDDLTPTMPRLPFRIVLKEYAQWVARAIPEEDGGARPTIESYLADRVGRSAAREGQVLASDIQYLIKDNPTLLILDGLDEVVDPALRRSVLGEIAEFLERASAALAADMQVIGSSRPTGYAGEFLSGGFLHLELKKLTATKVDEYVAKWIAARSLDASRVERVHAGFRESSEDRQVRLLLTTPLQVSIVIYIILAGGRPSRQRESLFDEYVSIIYKRERAKHRSMITTEKEVLLGLHKYLGYLVHKRAGEASHVRSALSEEEFRGEVETFLRHKDPYCSVQHLAGQVDTLVREARDRLVLIVEGTPGYFGFELRSLQEYFAASHLVETAAGSEQRYERFAAVATSIQWRNAALFFAGRVGRMFSGEAAELIEACRATDRDAPDRRLRRGSELALDLAVDRAFGPNQRLQRSAVEHALSVLEGDPDSWHPDDVAGRIHALGEEEIEQHVLEILNAKVPTLAVRRQVGAMGLYGHLGLSSDVPKQLLGRYGSGRHEMLAPALAVALREKWPIAEIADAFRVGVTNDMGAVAEAAAAVVHSDPAYMAELLASARVTEDQAVAIIEAAAGKMFALREGARRELADFLAWQPPTEPEYRWVAQVLIYQHLVTSIGIGIDPFDPDWAEGSGSFEDDVLAVCEWLDGWADQPDEGGALVLVRDLLRDAVRRMLWLGGVVDGAGLVQLWHSVEAFAGIRRVVSNASLRTGHPAAGLLEQLQAGEAVREEEVAVADHYSGRDTRMTWTQGWLKVTDGCGPSQRLGVVLGDGAMAGEELSERVRNLGGPIGTVGPLLAARVYEPVSDELLGVGLSRVADRVIRGEHEAARSVPELLSWRRSRSGSDQAVDKELKALLKALLPHATESRACRDAITGSLIQLAASGGTDLMDEAEAFQVLGESSAVGDRLWTVRGILARRAAFQLTYVGAKLADASSAALRGAAVCVASLGGAYGPGDGELPIDVGPDIVKDFLDSDDPLVRRAGVAMLPHLDGDTSVALVLYGITLLSTDVSDEMVLVWSRLARQIPIPAERGSQVQLLSGLGAALDDHSFDPRFRRSTFAYLRRIADAQEPALNHRERALGLPLA